MTQAFASTSTAATGWGGASRSTFYVRICETRRIRKVGIAAANIWNNLLSGATDAKMKILAAIFFIVASTLPPHKLNSPVGDDSLPDCC